MVKEHLAWRMLWALTCYRTLAFHLPPKTLSQMEASIQLPTLETRFISPSKSFSSYLSWTIFFTRESISTGDPGVLTAKYERPTPP